MWRTLITTIHGVTIRKNVHTGELRATDGKYYGGVKISYYTWRDPRRTGNPQRVVRSVTIH